VFSSLLFTCFNAHDYSILIALLYWNLTGDMQLRDVDKREKEEIHTLRMESERFGRWKKWLSVSPCTAYKGQIIETLFRLQSGKITHPPPLAPRGAQGPQRLLPEEGAGWHIAR